MTKEMIIKRLEKLVEASQIGDETYKTEIKVSEWNNYGKSRTYFSIVRTRENSRHYEKLDCGYFDNQSEEYVAGKGRDLSEDSVYDFGGNNLVSLVEEEIIEVEEAIETVGTTEETAKEVNVKFDRSQIFKKAWKLVKEAMFTLSQALKMAWAEAKKEIKKETKSMKKFLVEFGFGENVQSVQEYQTMDGLDMVEAETAKEAAMIGANTDGLEDALFRVHELIKNEFGDFEKNGNAVYFSF